MAHYLPTVRPDVTPPRFYVCAHTGFRQMRIGSDARECTEVKVLDRDYCHRVAHSAFPHARGLDAARSIAADRAAALNTWHEEQTAA